MIRTIVTGLAALVLGLASLTGCTETPQVEPTTGPVAADVTEGTRPSTTDFDNEPRSAVGRNRAV